MSFDDQRHLLIMEASLADEQTWIEESVDEIVSVVFGNFKLFFLDTFVNSNYYPFTMKIRIKGHSKRYTPK